MSPDWIDLLRSFSQNKVEYLVVGALAVIQYTEPRYTKDLDLWVNPTHDNAERVYSALKDFGAPIGQVTPKDFTGAGFYRMGKPPHMVDILMNIKPLVFSNAWENRHEVTIDGLIIPFLGYYDVTMAKTAAGRPQDLLDLENLKTAKNAEDFIRKTKGE